MQQQLADGLEHLLADAEALRCFRFMNQVMADQRMQTQVAGAARSDPELSPSTRPATQVLARRADRPHSWRPFQLAFILMQLPLLTDPARGEAVRRPGQGAAAVLPDRWRQDRGLPGPGRVHVRDPAPAGRRGRRRTARSTGATGSRC